MPKLKQLVGRSWKQMTIGKDKHGKTRVVYVNSTAIDTKKSIASAIIQPSPLSPVTLPLRGAVLHLG